MLQPDKIT